MNTNLLQGQLVRLVAANAEKDAEQFAQWSHDSEYARQLDSDPAHPKSAKQAKEEIQKWLENEQPDNFGLVIRTLADDRLIGFIGLDGIWWAHGDAFVGIGIGDPEYRGKGYGTDALRVILRYAFTELNLHRVSLDVFEYNSRAIRCYEKAGFVVEGRARQFLHRDGRRWDLIYMGILNDEWARQQEQ
jgi:RimJ/RimL family protein N-acetyltransferase